MHSLSHNVAVVSSAAPACCIGSVLCVLADVESRVGCSEVLPGWSSHMYIHRVNKAFNTPKSASCAQQSVVTSQPGIHHVARVVLCRRAKTVWYGLICWILSVSFQVFETLSAADVARHTCHQYRLAHLACSLVGAGAGPMLSFSATGAAQMTGVSSTGNDGKELLSLYASGSPRQSLTCSAQVCHIWVTSVWYAV